MFFIFVFVFNEIGTLHLSLTCALTYHLIKRLISSIQYTANNASIVYTAPMIVGVCKPNPIQQLAYSFNSLHSKPCSIKLKAE